jgi:hypothetical protein
VPDHASTSAAAIPATSFGSATTSAHRTAVETMVADEPPLSARDGVPMHVDNYRAPRRGRSKNTAMA